VIRYLAITTCNAEQWAQYGRAMATTFCRHWPSDVPLRLYAEGFAADLNGQVEFADFHQAAPWFTPWSALCGKSERGFRPQGYHFRWDCVKFAHKIAAISAAARTTDADVLIWLDADIMTHSLITMEWLDDLFPAEAAIAWLDRARVYPECGFLMFRLPCAARLIKTLRQTYKSGQVFKLPETHDSYVIQSIVRAAEARGEIKVASLSGKGRDYHHVLVNSPLSACLDHLKGGKRKLRGRTLKEERVLGGPHEYWT
jgi:hypothetical protein